MKRALTIYSYLAPLILGPVSFLLWRERYGGNLRLVSVAWLVPILWAYIVPGIGTNVLKVWEFNTKLRLGRFRPHHGFVFGSATAMIAWLVHVPSVTWLDAARSALIMCSSLAFWNLLYEVVALRSGILNVYNQPWADGRSEEAVAMDYAPWFFGGFGAMYGLGMGTLEVLQGRGLLNTPRFALMFTAVLALALLVPVLGYMARSWRAHGHSGTRPVRKKCQSA